MKYPIKCEKINQFKVLQYLDKEFELNKVTLKIYSENSIKLTDRYGESAIFSTDGLDFYMNEVNVKELNTGGIS